MSLKKTNLGIMNEMVEERQLIWWSGQPKELKFKTSEFAEVTRNYKIQQVFRLKTINNQILQSRFIDIFFVTYEVNVIPIMAENEANFFSLYMILTFTIEYNSILEPSRRS